MKEDNRFLVRVQFLGFRYSGWQKQPGQKTIEGMLSKTLKFILPNRKVKVLGAGRTDAKVSALDFAFEIFLQGATIDNLQEFQELFNSNLPPDIRVVEVTPVGQDFNIIKHSKLKEYMYLFSFGEKNHPFCAPFMANILDNLDLQAMKEAAVLFQGTHDFSTYTSRLRENSKFVRHIEICQIMDNNVLTANFFPKKSYALCIEATGFMRYQVRMIMGALIQLGKGELTLGDITASLLADSTVQLTYVAPGSGLVLNRLEF